MVANGTYEYVLKSLEALDDALEGLGEQDSHMAIPIKGVIERAEVVLRELA